ncbi:MAG TPA: acyl carrier protein [Azospirillaceae bacterium]|nr:acyl carrier protein [Azospirillaceae bacterium]
MLTATGTGPTSTVFVMEQVRQYIIDNFLLGDDSGLDSAESLLDSGIIDSTGIMDVVAFLESRFGVTVEDEDLIADNLDSVRRIAGFVERKLAAQKAA